MRPASTISQNQIDGISSTLVDDAVEATDEGIRFLRLRGQGQGRDKVRREK